MVFVQNLPENPAKNSRIEPFFFHGFPKSWKKWPLKKNLKKSTTHLSTRRTPNAQGPNLHLGLLRQQQRAHDLGALRLLCLEMRWERSMDLLRRRFSLIPWTKQYSMRIPRRKPIKVCMIFLVRHFKKNNPHCKRRFVDALDMKKILES